MIKNTHIWMPQYINNKLAGKEPAIGRITHIIFCLADHFEPKWGRPDRETGLRRVDQWTEKYAMLASSHKDADGFHPRHSIFYPQEEYEKDYLNRLAILCRQGLAEVEVHLHHDDDTSDGLRAKIEDFKTKLLSHGMLSRDKNGKVQYGFIHGNWALCNSRPDGRWCGVNDELAILKDTGCYADFTMPSAPSDTQTRKINSIYYAENGSGPRSHDTGIDVAVGREPYGDLMMIQGPLALNWKNRKFNVLPRIENSGISYHNPPTDHRVDLWINQRICVRGTPEWIFVKVYTHGAQDDNLKDGFFDSLHRMFSYLENKYNNGINYKLHYVAAREMYNIIKAAEAGEYGEPGQYRDYKLVSNVRL